LAFWHRRYPGYLRPPKPKPVIRFGCADPKKAAPKT
jgi:hypothetical protein